MKLKLTYFSETVRGHIKLYLVHPFENELEVLEKNNDFNFFFPPPPTTAILVLNYFPSFIAYITLLSVRYILKHITYIIKLVLISQ